MIFRHGLLVTVLVIAVIWSLSSLGYYGLAPVFGDGFGYDEAPVAFTLYYGAWTALAAYVFHFDIDRWAARHMLPQNHVLPVVFAVVFAGYALFVLPRLPAIDMPEDALPETWLAATGSWFLPKSMEILFQQILITALVLSLAARELSVARIGALVALLFGGFHLSLALSGENAFYVARYTVAATAFGAFLPYLMLRVRSGFIIAYAIHWSFYAVDLAIGHFVLG